MIARPLVTGLVSAVLDFELAPDGTLIAVGDEGVEDTTLPSADDDVAWARSSGIAGMTLAAVVRSWFAAEPRPGSQTESLEADLARGGRNGAPLPKSDAEAVVAAAYDAFEREIHTFALHSTRDPEAAADVTQEAFLRLLREAGERGVPENVRAWLYRVATNLVVSGARRVSVADRWRRFLSGPTERSVESPETMVLRRERQQAVHAALGTIPEDARTGLLLAANGFSGREIAEAIGRTELATRSLLCRARSQLRDQLQTRLADA